MIANAQEQSFAQTAISVFANADDVAEEDKNLIQALSDFVGKPPSVLAREAGLTPSTLTRPLYQPVKYRLSIPTLDKLRDRFPEFPGWNPNPSGEFDIPSNARPFQMEGASAQRMHRDVPVYGTALGAEEIIDGEAIEQTTLNRAEVVEYKRRPPVLDGRADVYGLTVQGESMSPAYRDGRTVFVEARKRPAVGDDAVIYLRSPDEIEGERIDRVLIKHVVRKTASYVELEQFTPPKVFRIPMERVDHMDRVLTLDDLIG
jgi:Peptidase S24-like